MAALVERAGLLHDIPRPGRFRSLVVISDPAARQHVVRSLHLLGAAEVVEAASVGEARVRARTTGPRDLVVVDGSLPDGSGIALLAELRARGSARGLVLSRLEDPYTVRAALAAGVRAFVVQQAAASGPGQGAGYGGVDGLSERELEVLTLVAQGQSNRDIGVALGLSALTVKSHLARIARKLGTGDRAEMVAMALRAGAIE